MKLARVALINCCLGMTLLGSLKALGGSDPYGELKGQEARLEEHFKVLQLEGFDAKSLTTAFATASGEVDGQFLGTWLARQAAFHEELDAFILGQQRYFLEEAYGHYREVVAQQKDGHYSYFKRRKLSKYTQLLEEGYSNYNAKLSEFGSAKDYQRIKAFGQFFHNYKRLMQALGEAERVERPYKKSFQKSMLKVSMNRLGVLKQVWFPSKRQDPDRPYTPLINKATPGIKSLFDELGFDVEVAGREFIPAQHLGSLPDEKTVNVFAMMHGNPFFDEGIKANIGLPHYMIVWALGASGLPRFIQGRLQKSTSILPVGSNQNTIELALAGLEKKYSDNIAIHPQGVVSTFNEVMPPHDNFASKFLSRLDVEGYKIRLVPVSSIYPPVFVNGHYFDGSSPEGGPKKMKAVIHQSLEPEVLAQLLAQAQGPELINHYIRSVWLEDMPNDDTQVMGQLRMDTVRTLMGPLLP